MHFTLSQRLFAFLALASGIGATINRPSESKGWQAEQDSLVEWDTAELTGPLNLHLCPGGAKDISQSIVQIAVRTSNTGSYKWRPPRSLQHHKTFKVIIIDASSHTTPSEDFYIGGLDSPVIAVHTSSVNEMRPSSHTAAMVIAHEMTTAVVVHETSAVTNTVHETSAVMKTVHESPAAVMSVHKTSVVVMAPHKMSTVMMSVHETPVVVMAPHTMSTVIMTVHETPAVVMTVHPTPAVVMTIHETPAVVMAPHLMSTVVMMPNVVVMPHEAATRAVELISTRTSFITEVHQGSVAATTIASLGPLVLTTFAPSPIAIPVPPVQIVPPVAIPSESPARFSIPANATVVAFGTNTRGASPAVFTGAADSVVSNIVYTVVGAGVVGFVLGML